MRPEIEGKKCEMIWVHGPNGYQNTVPAKSKRGTPEHAEQMAGVARMFPGMRIDDSEVTESTGDPA